MIGSCPMWLWSCCKVTEVWSSSAAVRYCDMQTVCNFFASSRLYCYVEINRGLVRYWSLMSDSISGPWKWMCLPHHFSYFVLVRMMEIPAQWNRPHWDSSGLLGKSMSEDKWLVEKEAGAKKMCDLWHKIAGIMEAGHAQSWAFLAEGDLGDRRICAMWWWPFCHLSASPWPRSVPFLKWFAV
jgi:hypothetical protein